MKKKETILALLCLVIIGTIFRLDNISRRTIGHIETYVPNIELPEEISIPEPRLTLKKTITGTIGEEPHPPAYYVLMFFWTKIFGTSLLSIRLPSVIFGMLSIILIYALCVSTEDKLTGIIAAGMLALNGHHIFWSQEAKFYSMACFLGILSMVLLIKIFKSNKKKKLVKCLYAVVTLTGLATVIYFWLVFAIQTLWVFIREKAGRRPVPGILRLQVLIFILGSPLWSMAAYQSKRAGYIDTDVFNQIGQFLQFGYLFQTEVLLESVQPALPVIGNFALIILASLLLIMGTIEHKRSFEKNSTDNLWPSSKIMVLTGFGIFLFIILFAKILHAKDPSRTILVMITGFIPLLLILVDFILKRYWTYLNILPDKIRLAFSYISHPMSLNTLAMFLPVIILAIVSIKNPLFIARGVLLFVPYLLIVLSRGLVSLIRRNSIWSTLIFILIIIHGFDVYHWQNRLHSPRDYKELYDKLETRIKEDDIVFVQPSWAITAMFYYLKSDRYKIIGRDYSDAIEKGSGSRVWVLFLPKMPISQKLNNALRGFQPKEKVEAFNIWAVLYEK